MIGQTQNLSNNGSLRVLIADDHDLYRAGLQLLLRREPAVGNVVEANNFYDAMRLLAGDTIGFAIFDLDMPGMNGACSFMELKRLHPNLPFIVISATTHADTIQGALDAGARRFICKSTPLPQMLHLICAVIHSEEFAGATGEFGAGLTSRQSDVLELLLQGMSNKEIGRQLGIAPGTVKIHLTALLRYFDAKNRRDLIVRRGASSPSASF